MILQSGRRQMGKTRDMILKSINGPHKRICVLSFSIDESIRIYKLTCQMLADSAIQPTGLTWCPAKREVSFNDKTISFIASTEYRDVHPNHERHPQNTPIYIDNVDMILRSQFGNVQFGTYTEGEESE